MIPPTTRGATSIRKIVVLGGGVTGWMTAAALARATAGLVRIQLIDDDRGDDGIAAEASLPSLRHYNRLLGLDDGALVRSGGAGFSLGIVFTGWGRPDHSYIQPFGETGAPIGPVAFHQLAAKLRAEGRDVRMADYSLAALCAQAGRFARPATGELSVLATYDYGLHLGRFEYTRALRAIAERLGVARSAGRLRQVERDSGGGIAAIVLDDGESIKGDFFVDCSGPPARLIGEALGSRFVSWSEWLPCGSILSAECDGPTTPDLYAHVEAHKAGWRRTVPLPGRRSESFVFCRHFLSDEAAESAFRTSLPEDASTPSIAHFEPGCREQLWKANCVAVGAAAGVLEPLESTTLHLVQQAIGRLIALFPSQAHAPLEAAEYNRRTRLEMERARDLIILHYKANSREGEPLWDQCRKMEVPETLAWKIKLYRSRGRVPLYDEEPFEEPEWVTVFDGQGIRPNRYDPLADAIAPEDLDKHLARLREVIIGAARTLPPYAEYLRQLHAGAEVAA